MVCVRGRQFVSVSCGFDVREDLSICEGPRDPDDRLSLCFQSFERELAELPGKYAPPDGRLYLARIDGETVGCIALRRLEDTACEMKRLYLRESARGRGVGQSLIERIINDARDIGYKVMRLDTYPPKMGKAVKLYESHGFQRIAPYYDNPHAETVFMQLDLVRN